MSMRRPMGLVIAGVVACGCVSRVASPVPKAVLSFEGYGEDVIDFYLANDWARAQRMVDRMSRELPAVERTMQEADMPPAETERLGHLVARLQEQTRAKADPQQAALTANQITAAMIEVERRFKGTLPIQIAEMDYLGREVVLLSALPQAGLLSRRVAALDSAWREIEDQIAAKGGQRVATRISALLAELKDQKTPREKVRADGEEILDLVDKLEALYR